MINKTFKFLAFALVLFSMACSGTNLSSNQNGKEEIIWLNSDYGEDFTIHDEVGVQGYQCYLAHHSETIEKDGMQRPTADWQPLCGGIEGFEDYKQGTFYKLKVVKTKKDKKNPALSAYRLVEVISKEQDRYYEVIEEKTAWINSTVKEGRCRGYAPPNCKLQYYEVQFGETLDKEGKWERLNDFYYRENMPEGSYYKVQYTKRYNPPARMIMDAPNYRIEDLKILSKEEDPYFVKIEKKTAWIGPKFVTVPCSGFAPPDCTQKRHLAQFGETLDKEGKWETLFDLYYREELKEGYIYQIEYTKEYNPAAFPVQDAPNFSVKDFKILSSEKVK